MPSWSSIVPGEVTAKACLPIDRPTACPKSRLRHSASWAFAGVEVSQHVMSGAVMLGVGGTRCQGEGSTTAAAGGAGSHPAVASRVPRSGGLLPGALPVPVPLQPPTPAPIRGGDPGRRVTRIAATAIFRPVQRKVPLRAEGAE